MSKHATFAVEFDPAMFERVTRNVREMRERSMDLSPAWDALLDWWSEQNFEQFLSRGNRYRTPWSPLAERTMRDKFSRGFPLDPLIRTGALAQDVTSRPLGYETITPSGVAAGTTIEYARFHMSGTRRMPARPLWSPAQIRKERAATSAVANYIIHGRREVTARLELRGPR